MTDSILDLIDGAIARNGDAMRWRPPDTDDETKRLAMDATLAMWRRKCRWGACPSFDTERWSDPT